MTDYGQFNTDSVARLIIERDALAKRVEELVEQNRRVQTNFTTAVERVEELEGQNERLLDLNFGFMEQNRKLREENHWIPVEERLPEDFSDVLTFSVWHSGERYQAVAYYVLAERCFKANGYWVRNVTHWRPLPKPPEVKP